MPQATAIQVIGQAAAELGLPVPTSAVTSRNATVVQLLALLNAAGYELMHAFEWGVLNRKAIITTNSTDSEYDLPSDFGKMINQTIWSSNSLQQVHGPMSPQKWEMYNEGIGGTDPFIGFRISNNKISFYPQPSAGEVTFEYISNGWVRQYLNPTVYSTSITNDLDTPLFDYMLLVKFLKLKMWSAKGLDTIALENEFFTMFNMITGSDKSAPIIRLARPRTAISSIPETGYGQ